jgi:hypothetical protein
MIQIVAKSVYPGIGGCDTDGAEIRIPGIGGHDPDGGKIGLHDIGENDPDGGKIHIPEIGGHDPDCGMIPGIGGCASALALHKLQIGGTVDIAAHLTEGVPQLVHTGHRWKKNSLELPTKTRQ